MNKGVPVTLFVVAVAVALSAGLHYAWELFSLEVA
jgi:hypothetical protein